MFCCHNIFVTAQLPKVKKLNFAEKQRKKRKQFLTSDRSGHRVQEEKQEGQFLQNKTEKLENIFKRTVFY